MSNLLFKKLEGSDPEPDQQALDLAKWFRSEWQSSCLADLREVVADAEAVLEEEWGAVAAHPTPG